MSVYLTNVVIKSKIGYMELNKAVAVVPLQDGISVMDAKFMATKEDPYCSLLRRKLKGNNKLVFRVQMHIQYDAGTGSLLVKDAVVHYDCLKMDREHGQPVKSIEKFVKDLIAAGYSVTATKTNSQPKVLH